MEENSVELSIPKKIGVHEDKKTKAQSIALPFKFLDGTNGAVIITRLQKGKWTPTEDIKAIKIIFQ